MPRIFPVVVKRTTVVGGGSCPPTATWAEDAAIGDGPVVGVDLAEDVEVADAVGAGVDLVEAVTVSDDLTHAGVAVGEDVEVGDLLVAEVVLADDVVVDDGYAAGVAFPEDLTVDDGWSSTLTGAWAEDTTVADDVAVRVDLAEDVTFADDPQVGTVFGEEWTVADDLAVATLLTDDVGVNDLTKALLFLVSGTRTGTPDADPMCDGYIDQANPTLARGGLATMLCKGKSALANDELRAGIEIDFTWAGDWTFIETGFTLSIRVSHGTAVINQNLDWVAYTKATRPFVESTWTWNTSLGTINQIAGGSISVPAGAATNQVVTINPTQAATLPGKWLFIQFAKGSEAAPPTFTIVTREGVSGVPVWTVDRLQRGV